MKKKILLIEDETELSMILSVRLQKTGFEVIVAYDGLEGLDKARAEKPDIIILDLMLPKLPGEEVCKEIRKDKTICATPIIMLTAKSGEVDKIVGKVVGADAYMFKPFDSSKLLEEIDRLLREKK